MSRERFIKKFGEQIEFIRSSCRAYDLGNSSEAFRIGTCLRTLFHKTKVSTPLVSHLRIEAWELFSSAWVGAPIEAYVGIQLNLNSATPVLAVPRLGEKFWPMPYHDWWDQGIYPHNGRTYSRKDLVLSAVNKDGGAHVDHELEEYYQELEAGLKTIALNGQNIIYAGGAAPFDQTQRQYCQNLHVAVLRQFGHEVLASERHYDWPSRLMPRAKS